MQLTPTMEAALDHAMNLGDELNRFPGGFWQAYDTFEREQEHFGTPTIEALVKRGALEYSKWRDGRNGRFPIAAKVTESVHDEAMRCTKDADTCTSFQTVGGAEWPPRCFFCGRQRSDTREPVPAAEAEPESGDLFMGPNAISAP